MDNVSDSVKVDPTIIDYGNKLYRKHYNNGDQLKYISNKLREQARLILEIRNGDIISLKDIIQPKYFERTVRAVFNMGGFNRSIATPSLVIK